MAQAAPTPRETKIFRNNRSLAVRIPAEFGHAGDRVRITREGDRLIIEPIKKDLLAILATLKPIAEEFPDVDEGLLPLKDIDL